jgi:two-component system cell cycle sensor histidine kinase/response regulator CckA
MVTDVVMPGLSGPDLAGKLAVLRSDMRVLYTSGYADDELAERGMLGTTYSLSGKALHARCVDRKSTRASGCPDSSG